MKTLITLTLALLLASCGETAQKQTAPLPVKACTVAQPGQPRDREFTFISKPRKTTELSFRVGGPVTQFDTRPGQFYKKGQTIAAIDPRDYALRKAEAEARCRQAETEYNRIDALYHKDNISGSSYEKARYARETARAARQTARYELDDTQLKAPFDGYVQKVGIERFQDVRPAQPVVSLIDLSQIRIEAYIPQEIAVALKEAGTARSINIRFEARPADTYTTTDIQISKSALPDNLSYQLTALLPNTGGHLLGGMNGTLTVALPADTARLSLFIPQTAVCGHSRGAYVWTLTPGNQVKRLPVRIGDLKNDNQIEIRSGLQPGDRVVLTGHAFLTDDQTVTVQEAL